ncbi:PolC-type DNA polymerase III [Roseburia hominis]|jgi:DNA polymerase-3 subunit alpha (Gram-positive type)|uniref:PolC-type DNA polymerase III n=1 Tax=Roseburia hominis TaxID=301301 RepID=UPI001C030BEB|nr:PolC-type DNA polymerase III [Roseburia hominis]MBT9670121.1 PolC-type DNA polymerase III [Roseburia hominis]
MAKRFFDVFPSLQVEGDMKNLLTETEVTKVGMNHERDHLRVYLSSTRLIHKKDIRQLESAIAQQIFKGRMMQVKVIEKYHLSEQYTPEKLLDLYRDSILEELKDYSLMEYNLLRTAKMEFTSESHMLLTLENTIIAQTRSHEIVEFLEKVICERCGLDLAVELAYEEPKESKYKKNSDLQIQFEIKNIMKKVHIRNDDGESVPAVVEGGAEAVSDGTTTSGGTGGNATTNTVSSAKNAAKPAEHAGKTAGNGEKGKKEFKRRFEGGGFKKSDNPDVIYGRDFEDEPIAIEKIVGEMGEVTIRCQVMTLETREIRNEKTIVIMSVTDFTDSIVLKIFTRNDQLQELLDGGLAKGAFLKIKGVTTIDKFDSELTIGSVVGIKKIADFTSTRADTSPEKRVELHCHTKMSDMDGVSDVKDIVKRAMKWGHKAIAITDHGDVQAFPDANHAVPPDSDFKIIYGVEAYLVDDLKDIIVDSKGQSLNDSYVVFDLETTGLSPDKNKIIEIGAVKVVDGAITERFSTFVNPEVPIPYNIEQLTSIKDDMVLDAPRIEEILPEFMKFCEGTVMVAHNAEFDTGFIRKNCERMGLPFDFTIADTVALARILLPQLNRFKLDTVAKAVGVSLDHHHRAVDDAACTAEIFVKFIEMLHERGMETLDDVNQMGATSPELVKKLKSHHAIILATNDIGRINLYRLVSMSHLTYFHKTPRVPKSEFVKYREGLLLGSACEAGELYRAILDGRPEEEIIRLVKFYDYLEIQPIGNNSFMLRDEKSAINSVEELQDINRRIVKLGETFNKLVVATCDVHFLDPEDEVYRRIIMAGKGFKDADDQAPLFLRTTEEMLKEFEYLGSTKAEEVVITNPGKIADMCEKIAPVRPDKCPPVIENSDQMLRDICYTKAHSMYGEELPSIVKERLDRELNSIISNGYAVMYIIAQKLVWKSNEDGYLVGSRGSVGSSFAATMSGITEVNPLQAHYRCAYCKYSDFDSPEVKAFSGRSGCDMPDKICPVCGKKLVKDGFDIPFETFLGFKGNKEPDIDLNFSGEYQSKAHAYCEVIFGYGQTFRAGTIGTLADKTAFGYIKNYYEERGVHKRNCEIDRIVQGCVGVRRTTGQHPGGIVVLPVGEEINTFTPVQHPANDMTTATVTTHFDYHSIDHNLLKLDILGHDDPTMIRMLQDLTGIDPTTIPLDDESVMSLFKNTSALGVTPDDIHGIPLGCLGIPEFGTDFAMQMVIDAKPQEFSDLIRISGLSHGTDVWLGNAQTLIEQGLATISTAICTRDDIMIYLIQKGLDSEQSFTIMESVRKGKGLKEEWKTEMRAHDVPEWYIDSCLKIKYMFPKAHAAAYVMMAWRIAYCKVYYPLAYYAAYFSIRATGFNYEIMCQGKERLEYFYKDYTRRKDSLSKKEQDTYRDMKIVQEMYARGFDFTPIDVYRAKPDRFQVIDGKLMPALNTIDGMGDNAAIAVAEAAKDGKFLSKDDFRQRTKATKTVIDLMADLGLLGELPESNQLSLFDFA